MTRLSVIIPSYNSWSTLRYTLRSLLRQERASFELEVIVADDGSSDETQRAIREFADDIQYVRRERDRDSSRARIRNLGLQAASGEHVCFLDSSLLLEPDALGQLLARAKPDTVLLPETLGLIAPEPTDVTPEALEEPQRLQRFIAARRSDPEWSDVRIPFFEVTNDRLDELPCPWTLAWTCALFAPRALLTQVAGFNQDFTGWGGEDIEMALRLYRAGASFEAVRSPRLLHWPHVKEPDLKRRKDGWENLRKLQELHGGWETELLDVSGPHYSNVALAHLERLSLSDALPTWGSERVAGLALASRDLSDSTLLVGVTPALAEQLGAAQTLAHSRAIAEVLAKSVGATRVTRSVGVRTGFADREFSRVIVSDYCRLLAPKLGHALWRELHRLSPEVWFVTSEEDSQKLFRPSAALYRSWSGWGWLPTEGVLSQAREAGFREVASSLPGVTMLRASTEENQP
jgi:glycosyltransferase involved in cell wall biosynthesis